MGVAPLFWRFCRLGDLPGDSRGRVGLQVRGRRLAEVRLGMVTKKKLAPFWRQTKKRAARNKARRRYANREPTQPKTENPLPQSLPCPNLRSLQRRSGGESCTDLPREGAKANLEGVRTLR